MFSFLRNRFVLPLLLFMSLASLFTTTVTAEGAAMIYTVRRVSQDHIEVKKGKQIWKVGAKVYWNWSHYAGDSRWGPHAWAKPQEIYVAVNAPGAVEPCGILDGYNGTDFTFTFYNHPEGYSHTTYKHHLGCAFDTTNGMWIDVSHVHRMYFREGADPAWRARVQTELDVKDDPINHMYGGFHRH